VAVQHPCPTPTYCITSQSNPPQLYAPHIIPFDDDDEDDMPTTLPLATLQQSEAPSPPSMPLTIQPTRVPTTSVSTTRGRTTTPPTRSTEYHRRAYDLPSTRNLIEYLHCVAGSPKKSTFHNELSRQGITNPSQVLESKTLPDTAPKMQQPQYSVTSHKHQRD